MLNDVRFEKWVYGGDALARCEGKVVLAPYLLPGETAQLELVEDKRGYARARLVRLLEPSPDRVEAGCEWFARCGGCHYQHAPYSYQLERKREILREVLLRIGNVEAPEQIPVLSSEPWGYRNRIQLHLDNGRIGLHEAGSRRLCAIGRCPIASPTLNRALASLRSMMGRKRFPEFLRTIELFTDERFVQVNVLDSGMKRIARSFFEWCAETIPGAMEPALDYAAGGVLYRVGHKSFFQVNRFLVDALVEIALEDAAGETALDLYAGVGLFSLPLARRVASVTAVESSAAAVADLEFNARRAGAVIQAVHSDAGAFLAALEQRPDFVVADPPRAGLGRKVVGHLVRLRPPRLHIVSCDPSTMARDLKELLASGYHIAKLTMVDLFPQTAHIETVVHLRRKD